MEHSSEYVGGVVLSPQGWNKPCVLAGCWCFVTLGMEQFSSAYVCRLVEEVGVNDGQFDTTGGGDGRVRCGVGTELFGAI